MACSELPAFCEYAPRAGRVFRHVCHKASVLAQNREHLITHCRKSAVWGSHLLSASRVEPRLVQEVVCEDGRVIAVPLTIQCVDPAALLQSSACSDALSVSFKKQLFMGERALQP